MKVDSKVVINDTVLRRLSRAQVMALEMTAKYLHTEIVQAQVMPWASGNLQDESTFVDTRQSASGTVSIVSSTPYARRMYYHPEYHFNKAENPAAGGKWFKDWLPGGKHEQDVEKAFASNYRRVSGV